jgi:Family of unknown function (DUF5999)
MTDSLSLALRSARLLEGKRYWHQPQCPDALAPDRLAAREASSHPEQGRSLPCNGVVAFGDGEALLPRQAQENREYVRRLLKERQPDFAEVLESVVRELACQTCLVRAETPPV